MKMNMKQRMLGMLATYGFNMVSAPLEPAAADKIVPHGEYHPVHFRGTGSGKCYNRTKKHNMLQVSKKAKRRNRR